MITAPVLEELKSKYPGKVIYKNNDHNPTEILCEVDPVSEHPEYSMAVAVIEKSLPHKHLKTMETYKIIKGKLILYVGDKTIVLHEGELYEIPLNTNHWAEGNETWVECTSRPGWTPEDHIIKMT